MCCEDCDKEKAGPDPNCGRFTSHSSRCNLIDNVHDNIVNLMMTDVYAKRYLTMNNENSEIVLYCQKHIA